MAEKSEKEREKEEREKEKKEADARLRDDLDFQEVLADELRELNRRRGKRHRPRIGPDAAPIGLALSGGGIRSASVCMGAIQALESRKRLSSIDYLSTVSGGGYTGACLSAAMSKAGGGYPFGEDVRDSRVIRHIRNYSNYLLPRSRSAIRNYAEAAVILLRGLVANAVCVLAFLLVAVLLTGLAFPDIDALSDANFLPRLLDPALDWAAARIGLEDAFHAIPRWPFSVPSTLGCALVLLLVLWAMLRSNSALDRVTSDTSSLILKVAYVLLVVTLVIAFLDLQPVVIGLVKQRTNEFWVLPFELKGFWIFIGSFASAISAFASTLGKFLQTSKRSQRLTTAALRGLTRAALLIAALVLPLLLWISYIALSTKVIPNGNVTLAAWLSFLPGTALGLVFLGAILSWAIMLGLRANGYSLHRLYRDRLSKAFLVCIDDDHHGIASDKLLNEAKRLVDLPPLDGLRLSTLQYSSGPYPLINAALNVQGSLRANKRGRNADFFTFTPHWVGSHLTSYAKTRAMQRADRRLDLATAMAISGAAASANMGSSTVRALSPTLALLNIRLGYYLKNPRNVREDESGDKEDEGKKTEGKRRNNRLGRYIRDRLDRFYLIREMFNGLTEDGSTIYLTDGGHIENLGIYALLKRRCGLILAIDSEADPELGCESLLKLERYARIDLGVRIVLPWEEIARHSRKTSEAIPSHNAPCDQGPHCAIGRIFYGDETEGVLVYVKSSLSGDEKDYVLDYAERNPDFPHETTGDQFFSEEQFEMYRALGFHMVDGLFGDDKIGFLTDETYGFVSGAAAKAALKAALPEIAAPQTAAVAKASGPENAAPH